MLIWQHLANFRTYTFSQQKMHFRPAQRGLRSARRRGHPPAPGPAPIPTGATFARSGVLSGAHFGYRAAQPAFGAIGKSIFRRLHTRSLERRRCLATSPHALTSLYRARFFIIKNHTLLSRYESLSPMRRTMLLWRGEKRRHPSSRKRSGDHLAAHPFASYLRPDSPNDENFEKKYFNPSIPKR